MTARTAVPVSTIAFGVASALAACVLALGVATPAHAVATVAADTTRAGGLDPLTAGRSTSLVAGGGNASLLRFSVRGLGRPPTRAVLRLRVTNATFESLAVRSVAAGFGEDDGAPATLQPEPNAIAQLSGAAAMTWAQWDVTTAVRGDGDIGLHVSGPLLDAASFSSREGPDAPQLVVTPDDDRGLRLAGLLDPNAAETFVARARDDAGSSLDGLDVIAAPAGQGVPGRYIGVHHTLVGGVYVAKLATSEDLTSWTHRADLDQHASQPTLAALPDGGFVLAFERDTPDRQYVSASNLVVRHYVSWAALAAGAFSRAVDLQRTLAPTAEGTPQLEVRHWNGPDASQIAITFHYLENIDVDRQAAGVLTNFSALGWAPQPEAATNRLFAGLGTRGNLGDRADVLFEGHRFAVLEAQSIKGDFGTWRWYLYDRDRNEARLLPIRLPAGSHALGNPTVRALRSPTGQPLLLISGFAFSEGARQGEAGQFIAIRHAATDVPPIAVAPPAPAPVAETAAAANPSPPPPVRPPARSSADRTPPAATVTVSARRFARTIAIGISCTDEPCRATAAGTVRAPRHRSAKARTYTLRATTKTIAEGAPATLHLRLPARTRRAIRRALLAGRSVAVKVRVRLADHAGNTRTLTRQLRLRR